MSILSWLGETLSKFINGFGKFVSKQFKKIPNDLASEIGTIINITNGIKNAVDSVYADVATTLIPGTLDDAAKVWLRARLPELLKYLHIIQDGVIKLSDDSAVKGAQLRAISSVLTQEMTGMDADQAAITSQVVYKSSTDI